jgi:vacuolar-type H+-ATPase subunit E/Vma4
MTVMGFKEAVLKRAHAERDAILSDARQRAEAVMASARERAEKRAGEIVSAALHDSEEEARKELGRLERELRIEVLREKNRVVEEALEKAGKKFRELSPSELHQLYGEELKEIDLTGATLLVPPGAGALFGPFAAHGAAIEEEASVVAGYVIERENFRLDRSLRARLMEIRAEMKTELARMLFEENT